MNPDMNDAFVNWFTEYEKHTYCGEWGTRERTMAMRRAQDGFNHAYKIQQIKIDVLKCELMDCEITIMQKNTALSIRDKKRRPSI